MAKKRHRKLYPTLASETNKKLDCSIGFCDPICPYNCYPWSSPPITAPSPSISAFYPQSQNSSSSFDTITILTITGSALVILLIGFFLVAKFVSDSVNHEIHERYQSNDDDNNTVEQEFQDRGQVDHPIWLIRTTGLQQSVINSITICNYKRGDGLIERTDCPICLSEFEEDESLRLLPKCHHAFHISCIDTWLRSHINCPLCRAGIATPRCSGPVGVTPGGSGSHLESDEVGEEGQYRGQIENRVELGRGRDDSDNADLNSDVRIEIYEFGNEINGGLEEIDDDGPETETKEKVRVLRECVDQNEGDAIHSLLYSKTHKEHVYFPGKSSENESQEFTRNENRHNGDEASCSEENVGHNAQLRRRSVSTDSDESNGEATEFTRNSHSDISLKTTGSSNKNKSSIFPL